MCGRLSCGAASPSPPNRATGRASSSSCASTSSRAITTLDRTLETRQGRRRREGPARDRRRLGRGRARVVVSPACHRRHAVRAEAAAEVLIRVARTDRTLPDGLLLWLAGELDRIASSLDELATKSEPSDADTDLQELAESCRSEAAKCHRPDPAEPACRCVWSSTSSATSCARAATRRPRLEAYAAAEKIDQEDGDEFFSATKYRKAMAVPLWQLGRYREALDELEQIDELAQIDEPEVGLIDEANPDRAVAGQARERPRRLRRRRNIQGLPVAQGLARARADCSSRRRPRAARCRRCAAPSGVAAVSPAGAANARARGGCKHHERDDAHRSACRARSRRELVLPGGCADAGRSADAGTRRRHRADARADRSADGDHRPSHAASVGAQPWAGPLQRDSRRLDRRGREARIGVERSLRISRRAAATVSTAASTSIRWRRAGRVAFGSRLRSTLHRSSRCSTATSTC